MKFVISKVSGPSEVESGTVDIEVVQDSDITPEAQAMEKFRQARGLLGSGTYRCRPETLGQLFRVSETTSNVIEPVA